jgi:hypothetical protein
VLGDIPVGAIDDRERDLELWGGKTSRECKSAMLTQCLTFSGSCSQPSKPRCAHARIWCSRTYSYAINSRCSPGRLEADRILGFTSGTSCCGSSLADSAPAGASGYELRDRDRQDLANLRAALGGS